MVKGIRSIVLSAVLLLLVGCTLLPGASAPTPFTFPTPNLTHTSIFAEIPTSTNTPSILPIVPTGTSTPSGPTPTTDPAATNTPNLTPIPTDVRPNGSPVTAIYLSAAPVIDGVLNEWSSTAYRAEKTVPGASSNWTGPSDLSATYYIGWDANALYIGVSRTDDAIVQISTGYNMYKGDDVEIHLDVDLPGDFSTVTMSADDFQMGLSAGNFGTLTEESYLWFPRSLQRSLSTVEMKALSTTAGYDMEAKIPWSVFGISPIEGNRFGFALSLSDNDLPGVAAWQSMVSSVSTRRVVNPTTWGTLILASPTAK
ncbi:MAG: sugar-binding protein [Chloroflexota bacterium]|nr:sugar-binding protein [Chloroflexota bacterium]